MHNHTEPIFKYKSLGCLQIFRVSKDLLIHKKCLVGSNTYLFNLFHLFENSKFMILQILTHYPCHSYAMIDEILFFSLC